ncbi:MAG TPA: hypothetical protein VGC90_07965 [Candidatus Limnocylindrales bacterium]
MNVSKLCDIELTYTSLESLDYEPGGQIYGAMEGSVAGERLSGTIRLTNLAVRRPDNVNLPTLRGVLTTETGQTAWVELDGVATLRASDQARVIAARCIFRTGSAELRWLNSAFVVYEGVLDRVAVGGSARGALHVCEVTVA